jgi:hypothetical protein
MAMRGTGSPQARRDARGCEGSTGEEAAMGGAERDEVAGSGGEHDFDFFMGSWSIRHRRLRERLKGCTAWEEFEGTCVARRLWGGQANIDEIEAATPSGPLRGLTLRIYEPASGQWRLYWANGAKGFLDAPMVGAFRGGRGEFFSHELHEGQGVFVRYVWSDVTAASCRWEQAFSPDGGRSWETNWIMEFARRP